MLVQQLTKLPKAEWPQKKQSEATGSVIDIATAGNVKANLKKAKFNREAIIKLIHTVYHLCVRKLAIYAENFENTVELLVQNGDDQLKLFLSMAPKNASYTSNMVLQEYIVAIIKYVEDTLLESLSNTNMFTLMADESTDIATIEEMSICGRWFTSAGNIEEHFLGLVPLDSCTAEHISAKLVEFMDRKGIQATR